MSHRELWAAVAETAIRDHRRRITAARARQRSARFDSNTLSAIGSVEAEIAAARQYFASRDWGVIASFAGLDMDTGDLMRAVSATEPRRTAVPGFPGAGQRTDATGPQRAA